MQRDRRESVRPDDGQERFELAELFLGSIDLMCVAGVDGYFKRLNPAWSVRLGWPTKDLLALPMLEFVHPADHEITLAKFDELAQGANTVQFDNRFRHRDGFYRPFVWNARASRGRKRVFAVVGDRYWLRMLERSFVDIADQEQERLGRDLHDGLCQKLAGIAAMSYALSRRLDPGSAVAATAAEITDLLNETNREVRQIARGLCSPVVNEEPLDAVLGELSYGISRMFKVSCAVACDRPFPALGRNTAVHLFRITQEAVSNAVVHGRATRIELRLSAKDDKGLLSVHDNGVGLSQSNGRRNGVGLETMTYRAQLIGGTLEVQPRAPRGAVVSCAFPLVASTTATSASV